ncbi:uncharacterized protein EI97DRAFT_490285 [Westerdykella ornata]|uniref:Cyclin n=1 Tax=Westerdykella ornata TaxID=318751 RepID=A0A6A6JLH5_WESOR|nr:uncharacterized protein EI97DRAFT_490285 [Westerdykella ornata]KAF2276798.1 hypothetical protein EI97DRAFT_490285 [Westerdykella ornata]
MPHAVRLPSFDFSPAQAPPSYQHRHKMQLPLPRIQPGYESDAFRPAVHVPTPPDSGLAKRAVFTQQPREVPLHERSHPLPGVTAVRPPPSRNSPPTQRHQQHPARGSGEGQAQQQKKSTVAPNLRIPESICTPQESLPQLAAEITCLFWFENSSTLKQVLNSASPYPTQPLVPDAIPKTAFRKWVGTILSTTQVAQNVIILALLFIWRLKKANPTVKGMPGSEYRLLTVALMLGNKFLDDNTYTNKTWAEVSGILVQEVHLMEVEFLSNMRYSLFTSKEQWDEWHVLLGKFGTFYDRASKVPPPTAISPIGTTTPLLLTPSQQYVPSPPTQQKMPPYSMSYSPSRSQNAYGNYRPSLSSQPTPTVASPINSILPEPSHPGPLPVRKRSSDNNIEPPAKRVAHGFAPVPYSNAPLISSLQVPPHKPVQQPRGDRLPSLPSLSIPSLQQNPPVQVHQWQELSLPAPGSRSMAMVYPPAMQWKQPFVTPTSAAASSNGTNVSSSYTTPPTSVAPDRPCLSCKTSHNLSPTFRQVSPYVMSAGSSPMSASFSSQRQLSPSFFLGQRQSPYRPVRGVQTLLVPPPSTAMRPASGIGYEQMQYQPLGRPLTERRVGPLPYFDERPWDYNSMRLPQPRT